MLHAAFAFAALILTQPAADPPAPLKPTATVEILVDAEPATVACRGVRMSDGRIVAPLVPLVGIKALRVRGDSGKDQPVLSIDLPQSPFLLVLSLDAAQTPATPLAHAPSIAGFSLAPLAQAPFSPRPDSVLVQSDLRHAGFRTFISTQAFTSTSLGAVATGEVSGMLVGPFLEPRPFKSFAVLDPASLSPRERLTPQAWGDATAGDASRAAAKALRDADPKALALLLHPGDLPPEPIAAPLLVLAVMELVNAENYPAVLDAFASRPELSRDERTRSLEAVAALQLDKADLALTIADTILNRNALDDGVRGSALAAVGRHKDAETALRAALAKEPALLPAWSVLGSLMASLRNTQEAVRCADQCLALDRSGRSARPIAETLDATGRFAEAETLRRNIAAADPTNPDFPAELARNLVLQKKFKDALAVVDDALSKSLRTRLLLEAAVRAAAGLADPALLAPRVSTLLKHFPDAKSYVLAAAQWQALGVESEALKLLDPVAPKFNDDAPFCLTYAALLNNASRWADAAGASRRVLALDPKNAQAPHYLFHSLVELRQFDEADRLGTRLLDERPAAPHLLSLMIIVAHSLHDDARVDAFLERLRAVDRNLADQLDARLKREE